MKRKIDYSLYLVTDRDILSSSSLENAVESAIKGGCTVVQLREKTASSREFYNIALKIKAVTDHFGVPLIINDRVDIALAVDADGVHVGQSDIPASVVRNIIGCDKILGVSANDLCEAVSAQNAGVDYIGVGAMFATGTKTDARLTSMEELHLIRENINIPIVVIGGINKSTIPMFKGSGIDGIAVVSAIIGADDIESAAHEIKTMFKENR